MMDQFDKFDNYESRFSGQVWAGVSQHLEEQKKQKRTRRALYIGSTTLVLLSLIVGYYTVTDITVTDSELVVNQENIELLDFYGASVQNADVKSELTFHKEDNSAILRNIQLTGLSRNQNIGIEEELRKTKVDQVRLPNQKEDNSLLGTTLNQARENGTFEGHEAKQIEIQKTGQTLTQHTNRAEGSPIVFGIGEFSNSQPFSQLTTDNVPKKELTEITDLNKVNRLKSNQSLRSLFVKEGCNLLDASPFRTYAWSQFSAFAPISIQSAKSSQYQEYSDARQSTEKALISPEFGFGVGVKSKSGLFFESGFQFAYYRERLGYIDPESINVQTIITTDSIFINGEVEVTSDTTIIQIPGSREVVNYNSHKTVSIPLIIGFDKHLSSSWSVGGKVGTIFNLFKQTQGRILDEEMVIRDIVHNEGSGVNVYNTRLTAQLLLGSQVRYHFSPSLDVYLSGDIRFNAKSITLDDYSLSQRFTTPVLSTGMRYYF